MSKVVTSKFGDRQLVQLPPVSFSRSRSAEVPSIVPNYYRNQPTQRGEYTNRTTSSMQDGQYGSFQGSQNIQPTVLAEGNIVRDINNLGTDYKVVQPNTGGPSLQYTPYAMGQQSQTQPQPQPQQYQTQPQAPPLPVQSDTVHQHHSGSTNEKHIFYGPNGELLPGPPPGMNMPGSSVNPNEKHIYYGPNGEVLPGPPQMAGATHITEPQKDFVVEGVLQFGKLVAVFNIDHPEHFPKLPAYLLKSLIQKYGQFERTDVRIAYRWGEYNVHGVPHVYQPVPKEMPPPPPPAVQPPPIVENATEEIVEYIYPGDKGYEEAAREIKHRELLGDHDKGRPVTVKEYRGDRSYYTRSIHPDKDHPDRSYYTRSIHPDKDRPETMKEYRGDRSHYTRSIYPEDRGYRRVVYNTQSKPWTARPGPEDDYYRRYNGPWTATDDRDYRRRALPRTATDDPLEGLRWRKERATIAEDKKYTI